MKLVQHFNANTRSRPFLEQQPDGKYRVVLLWCKIKKIDHKWLGKENLTYEEAVKEVRRIKNTEPRNWAINSWVPRC